MPNSLLYLLTVLIWGSTWLAIEFQLGVTDHGWSVTLRFAIAAAAMWAYCLMRGLSLRFSLRDHGFIALLALGNFSLNYYVVYEAQIYLTSAMTCILFTTMVLMNIINARLFFGSRIAPRTYIGALLGIGGIVAIFWPELHDFSWSNSSMKGMVLALASAFIASLGNMVSVRNSRQGLPVLQVNALGMLYGALMMLLVMLASGTPLVVDRSPGYWLSLLYLALFGSVIAFGAYFVLLKRIGAGRASYAMVLFPVVAVVLSALFEEFHWQHSTTLGFVLVALGNLLVLAPLERWWAQLRTYGRDQPQKSAA